MNMKPLALVDMFDEAQMHEDEMIDVKNDVHASALEEAAKEEEVVEQEEEAKIPLLPIAVGDPVECVHSNKWGTQQWRSGMRVIKIRKNLSGTHYLLRSLEFGDTKLLCKHESAVRHCGPGDFVSSAASGGAVAEATAAESKKKKQNKRDRRQAIAQRRKVKEAVLAAGEDELVVDGNAISADAQSVRE